mgnify:CR=1 FL=1
MSTEEQMLKRLAEHRERMALAGRGTLLTARFDREKENAITREIESYWKDMTDYYEREHDG